jgi:phosphoglycerate dehydrogenase-like enzyme
MFKAIFLLDPRSYEKIYPPEVCTRISQLVDIYAPLQTAEMVAENPAVLNECEAIFSGWGHPVFTSELLQAALKLKVVFYGARSIRGLVTDAFWERRVRITSAWAANAVPVVEYCLAPNYHRSENHCHSRSIVPYRADIPPASHGWGVRSTVGWSL